MVMSEFDARWPSSEAGLNALGARRERDYLIEDYMAGTATYELGESHMHIHDPAWGEEFIGDEPYDQLLIDLARTPLFQRLQAIEQLSLGPDYATMPNSTGFSRWQHLWGSVVFVRKMLEGRDDISDRDKMVMQVRTLISDAGQTIFSHLGDHLFQGVGGSEDLHDLELKDIIYATETDKVFAAHGFAVDEVVFPPGQDWVECKKPDLCVDRVDYGMREILRWGVPTIPINMHMRELHNPQSIFEIDDQNRLLMKSQMLARYFAAGYSILPTEHWAHPVHRLQMTLLQSAVRSSVIDKVEYTDMHPREAVYGIDNDFYAYFQTWDMMHLQIAMKNIALSQRRVFTEARRADLNTVFSRIEEPDWRFPQFPDPLTPYSWQSREYGYPYSAQLEIEEVDSVDDEPLQATDRGLQVNLPALNERAIDPLVKVQGGTMRLSELEPSYRAFQAGQHAAMAKIYRATVLMRPDVARRIVAQHTKADKVWPQLLARPRNPQTLKRVIDDARFLPSSGSFDEIRDTQKYAWLEERVRELGRQGVEHND